MKQIKIKIGANGNVQAETIGMKGKSCLEYIDRIEKMADAVTHDSDFTDEYYESQEILEQNNEEEIVNYE